VNTEHVVEAHQLVKRFNDIEAVKGVDFTIARGESFGFLGPNGAGKTNLGLGASFAVYLRPSATSPPRPWKCTAMIP
jgi:ABC-type Na+ transport system ATPase subunit NatA